MKFVLLLFVVTTCCYAFPSPDEWESYKVQYGKSYSDPNEEQRRKEIFLRNKQLIEEHNKKHDAGQVTYRLGLNNFSDWTEEEMKTQTGFRRPSS